MARIRVLIAVSLGVLALVATLAVDGQNPRPQPDREVTVAGWLQKAVPALPAAPVVMPVDEIDQRFTGYNPYTQTIESPLLGSLSTATYDDSGSGSGSGYAAAPAPPPYNVNEDPAFLAFVAALDQARSQAGAVRQQSIADADTRLADYKPRIAEAGQESRRRISGQHELRGMFRSGTRLRDLGLQQRAEAQQVGDLETGVARAKTAASMSYDSALADLARQQAEKALELTTARSASLV